MSEIIASGIVQKSTLQQYIDVFTPVVDEGKLHFNDDGLQIRCVDSANVAMVNPGLLNASAFESYDPTGSVTQGLDLNRLEELINPADSNALIQVGIDMETRKLKIQYENVDTAMGLFEPDTVRKEPDHPDLDLPNEIVIEGRDLNRVATVGDAVSDHIEVKAYAENETVDFIADGDIDDTTISFELEDRIDGNQTKPVESLFSLEYLKRVANPIPKNAEVTIQFGEEFPMTVDWVAKDGGIDVHQMLAPRIVTD